MTDKEKEEKGRKIKGFLNDTLPDGYFIVGLLEVNKEDNLCDSLTCARGITKNMKTTLDAAVRRDPELADLIRSVAMDYAMEKLGDEVAQMRTAVEKMNLSRKYGSKMGEA